MQRAVCPGSLPTTQSKRAFQACPLCSVGLGGAAGPRAGSTCWSALNADGQPGTRQRWISRPTTPPTTSRDTGLTAGPTAALGSPGGSPLRPPRADCPATVSAKRRYGKGRRHPRPGSRPSPGVHWHPPRRIDRSDAPAPSTTCGGRGPAPAPTADAAHRHHVHPCVAAPVRNYGPIPLADPTAPPHFRYTHRCPIIRFNQWCHFRPV